MRHYTVKEGKEIWEAVSGETLMCVSQPVNSHDKNAMAVENDVKVIGHLS